MIKLLTREGMFCLLGVSSSSIVMFTNTSSGSLDSAAARFRLRSIRSIP